MLFRHTRTSQPQGPVGVDASFSAGLISVDLPNGEGIYSPFTKGVWTKNGTLTGSASGFGKSLLNTSSGYWSRTSLLTTTGPITVCIAFTPTSVTGSQGIWSVAGSNASGSPKYLLQRNGSDIRLYAGSAYQVTLTGVAAIGKPLFIAVSLLLNGNNFVNNRATLSVNGQGATSASFTNSSGGTNEYFGSGFSAAAVGHYGLHFASERYSDLSRANALSLNPWQIFEPESRQIWVPSSSATNYTLTADAGVYALSGQTAEITRSRLIDGTAGSYSLVGQDATIAYTPVSGYVIDCESGSYSLTGQSAEIVYVGSTRNGGAPAWNPYSTRGETEEQKRTRRLAQGIIKQAQKPSADVEKLSVKAKQISEKLQRDAQAYELEAKQLSVELARAYDARLKAAAMNALNDALATRQLEQQLVITQVQAEMVRQQIEELDVVFMAVMLAAM